MKKLTVFATLWFLSAGPCQAFDYLQPLPNQPMIPDSNPQTEQKIQLGKQLFFDTHLSTDNTLSCNSCHNLLTGGDDDRAVSIGPNGRKSKRSAPGLWNIGLQTVLFWDGRATTLELAMQQHIPAKNILNMSFKTLTKKLNKQAHYKKGFEQVFQTGINRENISQALSSFLRALMAKNSPFDRYLRGDKSALSKMAVEGIKEFNEIGCLACHFGTNFAGPAPGPAMGMGDGFYELFPNTLGSRYDQSHQLIADTGRMSYTKNKADRYLWRVPPLRNIALTAPYFHNGSAKTLREAIIIMAKTQLEKDLNEDQIAKLLAFLNSLTGQLPEVLE